MSTASVFEATQKAAPWAAFLRSKAIKQPKGRSAAEKGLAGTDAELSTEHRGVRRQVRPHTGDGEVRQHGLAASRGGVAEVHARTSGLVPACPSTPSVSIVGVGGVERDRTGVATPGGKRHVAIACSAIRRLHRETVADIGCIGGGLSSSHEAHKGHEADHTQTDNTCLDIPHNNYPFQGLLYCSERFVRGYLF